MNEFERISCHHFVEINGYAYFSNWFYNGLFQVELKTGKTVFLGCFEKEIKDELNVHWELIQKNNLIYFLPRRGRHVHIYSLDDHSVTAIEIRKISEEFFRVGEVIVDEVDLIFLPMEENAPVRRFNLDTRLVTNETNIRDSYEGVCLSQNWTDFPAPQLLEKYTIEQADKISWKQMTDGKWCAFLPLGRCLLWYIPEECKIEKVPLIVTNEKELDHYLQSIGWNYLRQGLTIENRPLAFQMYLKIIKNHGDSNNDIDEKKESIGQNIWYLL